MDFPRPVGHRDKETCRKKCSELPPYGSLPKVNKEQDRDSN